MQRLYSMLSGKELDPDDEEGSQLTMADLRKEPVLEYFDAFLIGLTATPSRQTSGKTAFRFHRWLSRLALSKSANQPAAGEPPPPIHPQARLRRQISRPKPSR